MPKIKKVKARTLHEKVNLDTGRKYYFGTSPHRRISVYFKTKKEMLYYYNNLIKRQKEKDEWLLPIEKKKQNIYVLTR